MTFKGLGTVAVALWCCAVAPAHAQGVKLRFHEGLVTLSTQNAPLRAILAEWARLGGATIVNGDRVAGSPLTLELNAVPERQALDILLRSVSGYMAAPRAAAGSGVAVYDRILILPTSNAPRTPQPQPGFQAQRPNMAPPQVAPPPIVDNEPTDDDLPENPLARMPGFPGRPPFPVPTPTGVPGVDPPDTPEQAPPPQIPGNPFGIPAGASARPGIIPPAPPPARPGAPPNPEP
jgi:hypothetical protein